MAPKGRKSQRTRKVGKSMAYVDQDTRKLAVQQHLEQLELDEAVIDPLEDEDDDDILFENDEPGRKRGRGSAKRKTRRGRGQLKPLSQILEEAADEESEDHVVYLKYVRAEAPPPLTQTPLKLCSVCGDDSSYQCTRCGQRYCSRRCHTVHTETRCLKFMV